LRIMGVDVFLKSSTSVFSSQHTVTDGNPDWGSKEKFA